MCFGGGGGDGGGGGQEQQPQEPIYYPTYNPYVAMEGNAPVTSGGATDILGGAQGQGAGYVPATPWEGQSSSYVPGAAMQLLRMRQSPQYIW